MNNNVKYAASTIIIRLFLILCTIFFLYPFFWNIISSFKTNTEFMLDQVSLPKQLAWDNYARAFVRANMGSYFLNSVFVTALSITLLIAFVVPISYVLARYRFFGSRFIENLFMICIFIQAQYIMVPLFVQLHTLRMTDNLIAMSLVYAVLQFPFSIFLLTSYMRSISRSFEESARIDGCSNWRILTGIIAPLAKPGIATISIIGTMAFWNEYPLALVLIRTMERRTLPIGLAHLFQVQRRATDFGALFAALVIVLIPTVIVYLIGQRHLLKGIAAGGIKE